MSRSDRMSRDPSRAAIEAAWHLEWPKLVAALTRVVGDIDLAEDLAQDALVAALQQWPSQGVPPRPGAWLMVTAKHQAIDRLRRDKVLAAKHTLLGQELLIASAASARPGPPRRSRRSRTICCE